MWDNGTSRDVNGLPSGWRVEIGGGSLRNRTSLLRPHW
jgi:hypothetical protein